VADVRLDLSEREAKDLHDALGTTLVLMGEFAHAIPWDAPLFGVEERLQLVARRLDHAIRRCCAVNPHVIGEADEA
jgi:hypothetical protein